MKTNMKFLLVALVAFVSFSSVSCSSDDDSTPAPTPKTIAQIAQGNANLSILVEALTKADLVTTLNTAGTYTVFAPDNAAFTAAGITSDYIANQTTPEQIAALKNVLLNHVLATKFTAAQLTTSYKKTLATSAAVPATATDNQKKMNVYIKVSSDGVFLNDGCKVTSSNIAATNGIVHIVNKVIKLPTIVTFVAADPNFSSLLTALTRADQLDENFVSILSGTASSPFTVFAPNNTAFSDLLTELPGGLTLATIPEQTLTNALKYHVVTDANVLSTTLFDGQLVDTFLPGDADSQKLKIEISTVDGAGIRDSSNRLTKFEAVDVQANNGVIHVIKKVLLPTL